MRPLCIAALAGLVGCGPSVRDTGADVPGADARGPAGSVCAPSGFCWEHPVPQANLLSGVHAFDDGEVWAVGGAGTVLRREGEAWSGWTAITDRDLLSVWGASADDVWVSGHGGTLLRWNGAAWTTIDTGTYRTLSMLHGTSSDDVWVVGDASTVRRWNGSEWKDVALPAGSPALRLVAVSARGRDVWIAGESTVLHFDGAAWTSETLAGVRLTDVVASEGGVWLAGTRDGLAVVLRRGAEGWTTSYESEFPRSIASLAATATGLFAAGSSSFILRFDGAVWHDESLSTARGHASVAVGADGVAWIVGEDGTFARRDGNAWTQLVDVQRPAFDGAWGSVTRRWAVSGSGDLLEGGAHGWKSLALPDRSGMLAVHGRSDDDVWAVGTGGRAAHFDGREWKVEQTTATTHLTSVFVAAPREVWAAGGRSVVRRQADGWTLYASMAPAGVTISALSGTGPRDVWAVGSGGFLAHWDGTSWSGAHTDGRFGQISAVLALAPDRAFAAGSQLLEWNGERWAAVAGARTTGAVRALAATGPDDLWLFGTAIARWDGKALTSWTSGSKYALRAGIATPGGVWAFGESGVVLGLRR